MESELKLVKHISLKLVLAIYRSEGRLPTIIVSPLQLLVPTKKGSWNSPDLLDDYSFILIFVL